MSGKQKKSKGKQASFPGSDKISHIKALKSLDGNQLNSLRKSIRTVGLVAGKSKSRRRALGSVIRKVLTGDKLGRETRHILAIASGGDTLGDMRSKNESTVVLDSKIEQGYDRMEQMYKEKGGGRGLIKDLYSKDGVKAKTLQHWIDDPVFYDFVKADDGTGIPDVWVGKKVRTWFGSASNEEKQKILGKDEKKWSKIPLRRIFMRLIDKGRQPKKEVENVAKQTTMGASFMLSRVQDVQNRLPVEEDEGDPYESGI